MSLPLTIWCNVGLPMDIQEILAREVHGHKLLMDVGQSSNLVAGGPSPLLEDASIAFGQPDPNQVRDLPNLKWVHLTSAGYTRYDRSDVKTGLKARNAFLTNSSSVYADPCAQHALAFLLNETRQIPASLINQSGSKGWPTLPIRAKSQRLRGQTILIVGYGAIGRRLTELLKPFDLNLEALRRTPTGDEPIPTRTIQTLYDRLPLADVVVNVLPQTSDNDHIFNQASFERFKPGSIFINIGRGTTVDQSALIAALESGHVGSAYLDVTDPEPLPSDHPLWRAPRCLITPHTAGGFQNEPQALVEHFIRNLRRFEVVEPLQDLVF